VNTRPRVQIFGVGRAGLAVARRARDQGVLAGAWNRSPLEGARAELARNLPVVVSADPGDAADSGADLWLVAVADDAVPEIAAETV
jgi:predicted dinucleotide-binding enzyme